MYTYWICSSVQFIITLFVKVTYNTVSPIFVAVVHPDSARCQPGTTRSEKNRILTADNGYISSWLTETTLFGSPSCPWVIQLEEGQKVNITLFDFAVAEHRKADASMCTMYASIKVSSHATKVKLSLENKYNLLHIVFIIYIAKRLVKEKHTIFT